MSSYNRRSSSFGCGMGPVPYADGTRTCLPDVTGDDVAVW